MIGPVYFAPIFNTYQPLQNAEVREPILRMAHANGIQADEVWGSRMRRDRRRGSART